MGISKEAFEEGKKPAEKGSLEYDILVYLKNAKKTDEPARSRKEILEALNKRKSGTRWDIEVRFALLTLGLDGMVIAKHIKTKGKFGYETYYMANE